MASKSAYQASEKGAEIQELLDDLDKLLERLRAMYEQYFLGISKMAPSTLHTEAERKIRDVTQIQIKNTALRYRFATISQKFGAYNMYWKRTMRQIEQGKYVRDLQRVQRQAIQSGEEIPEEILAAMPKLMRERVERDRAAAIAREGRKKRAAEEKLAGKSAGNMHRLDEALVPDDVNVEDLFAQLTAEAEEAVVASKPPKPEEFDGITSPNLQHLVKETPKAPPPKAPAGGPIPAMRGGGPPPVPPPRPQTTMASPPPPPATRPAPNAARPTPGPPSRPAVPPPAARAGTPPVAAAPPPPPPPGMSEGDTRSLYTKYLKARELCGESNDGVTYDKLMRTLRSQSSKIMSDARVKGVEFGVVIKDNKVILKAKPKT